MGLSFFLFSGSPFYYLGRSSSPQKLFASMQSYSKLRLSPIARSRLVLLAMGCVVAPSIRAWIRFAQFLLRREALKSRHSDHLSNRA